MQPQHANVNGSVFGGVILQMVDKAGAVCAMRHADLPCVTVAIDRVDFLVPIEIGDFVTVEAHMNFAGRTSMEVGVEVYAENLTSGSRRHTNSCFVTMVAMKDGKPTAIPGLLLEKPEEKIRYAAALERREHRKAWRPPTHP